MQINLKVPISRTGYGVVGKKIAEHMYLDPDIDVVTIPIGSSNLHITQEEGPLFQEILKNREMPHIEGHSLKIWHQNDLMDHVGNGRKIGFPIFEMNCLTEVEAHHIGACDKILVCSEWAGDIVIRELYNRYKWSALENFVSVVPLGVDGNLFFNTAKQHTTTRFFNCGKWEIRKGHDLIITAFEKAFTEDDNVELHMMCTNPFTQYVDNNAWNRYYTNGPLKAKVNLIEPVQSHIEVASIMQQMDCGVFPARAEGFNLELLEAMACGMQIITTDYSAHTEYCDSENAQLIPVDDLETAQDGIWFKGQGKWAKLDDSHVDIMADYMKNVHCMKQDGENMVNTNGINTAKKFTWENSINRIKEAL